MSKGKFSQPRPYRDEEREIEEAFRQVTGQAPPPEPMPEPPEEAFSPYHEDLLKLDFNEPALPKEPEFSQEIEFPTEEDRMPQLDERPHRFQELVEEPEGPDFFDKVQAVFHKVVRFCGENPKVALVSLCGVALVIIVGIMAALFMGTSDPYGSRILNNVYVANVNVGGLTKKEATQAVKSATSATFGQDMVIDLAGTPLRLSPKDTGVSLDVKAAVNAAYDYGRTGSRGEQDAIYQKSLTEEHFIGLLPYLKLNHDYIRKVLTDYAQDAGSTLTQTAYGLEGKMPELAGDKFNASAPCQTLVITMGTPGVGFDPEAVLKQVLDAYSMNQFLVTVEDISSEAEPKAVDLDAIYEELYIAPVNSSVDLQTFEPIPGSYGYGFDLEAARTLVENAGYGEVIRIPMEYIEPEIIGDDVMFRDVLGEYETDLPKDKNRSENIRLACEAINGLELNPGEEFSFNKTLGERTGGKGYKYAQSDNDKDDNELGGGIAQAASTLYYSVLLADLDVTQRDSHSFVHSYIDYGFDAAIAWKKQDFKFKNSTGFPIRIEAQASGGYVTVKILGTDEKDYYIKLQYEITETNEPKTDFKEYPVGNEHGYKNGDTIKKGVTGYRVKTYKLKYDKETGELLTKDFEANSTYDKVNKVVAVVKAPVETTEPTTKPTTKPTTEPTEETTKPTEKPTDPTEKPTKPTEKPTEPTEKPTEKPTEPTEKPTDPTTKPTDPPTPPVEPGEGGSDNGGGQTPPPLKTPTPPWKQLK